MEVEQKKKDNEDKSLGSVKAESLNKYAILDSISEKINLVTNLQRIWGNKLKMT